MFAAVRRLVQVAVSTLLMGPISTQAGDPSARELTALAPVLDSGSKGCRSLDIGGVLGDGGDSSPKMRFHASYRAPDRFGLSITDAIDGTPLVLCSGNNLLAYDPVEPSLLLSRIGGFELLANCSDERVNLNLNCLFFSRGRSRVLVDLRSILVGASDEAMGSRDEIRRLGGKEFSYDKWFGNGCELKFKIDLANVNPYRDVRVLFGGATLLSLDRMDLDGPVDDPAFAFPSDARLSRHPHVKDVTSMVGVRSVNDLQAVLTRAIAVRSYLRLPKDARPAAFPGVLPSDWDRIKENDRSYSPTLKDLLASPHRGR